MILRTLTAAALLLGTLAASPARPRRRPADSAVEGYVWRTARPADKVCVTPATRARTLADNALKATRWVDDTHTCEDGYVWREAFHEDDVCVLPSVRDQARADNAANESRQVRAKLWITTQRARRQAQRQPLQRGPGQAVRPPHRRRPGLERRDRRRRVRRLPRRELGQEDRPAPLPGAPNAYARAQDAASGRWSVKVPLRVGC